MTKAGKARVALVMKSQRIRTPMKRRRAKITRVKVARERSKARSKGRNPIKINRAVNNRAMESKRAKGNSRVKGSNRERASKRAKINSRARVKAKGRDKTLRVSKAARSKVNRASRVTKKVINKAIKKERSRVHKVRVKGSRVKMKNKAQVTSRDKVDRNKDRAAKRPALIKDFHKLLRR